MIDLREHDDLSAADQGERWVVILRDAGGSEQPPGRRVAAMLKRCLRDWKLRCVEVSSMTTAEQLAAARNRIIDLQRENARLRRRLSQT